MRIRADIYLYDEAPRIGCGWRRCHITAGPKRIRIEECATGRAAWLDRWPLDGRTMKRYDRLAKMAPKEVQ